MQKRTNPEIPITKIKATAVDNLSNPPIKTLNPESIPHIKLAKAGAKVNPVITLI
ncbi:hypothetical protein D3C86_2140810 [compost metagenome]